MTSDDAVNAELEDIRSFTEWVRMPLTSYTVGAAVFETGSERERYLLAASCAAEDVYRVVMGIDPNHLALPVLDYVQARLNELWESADP